MAPRILIAHANDADAQARGVRKRLGALGYAVKGYGRGARRADKVVMLWSRAAWGTPALRAAARRAHAAGKLVCVRLDHVPPPIRGARLTTLPDRRDERWAWRRLLNPKPRALVTTHKPRRAKAAPAETRKRRTPLAATTPTAPSIQEFGDMRRQNSRGFAIALTLTIIAIAATGYAYNHNAIVQARIDGAATSVYEEASKLAALAP